MSTSQADSAQAPPFAAEAWSLAAPRDRVEEEVVALFGDFRSRLLRYLLTFGLGIADSEEVVQDVFLLLYQHLRRGGPRPSLRGWVFRVAHNLALKQRRRARPDSLDWAAAEAVDPAPNPEDRLARSQVEERVNAVVRALSEPDRRCLSLRAEGLRYREIAEVLGISLGGVAQSLARSLDRIARATGRS